MGQRQGHRTRRLRRLIAEAPGRSGGRRYAPAITTDEFDAGYFERLSSAREHWWVRGMIEVAARMVGPLPAGSRVLDLGCGSGANFRWLSGVDNELQGTDLSMAALEFCGGLGPLSPPLTCSTITQLPYRSQSFDLVVNADVLQHISSEVAVDALREVRRVLVPGGRLFVRTNAAFGRSRVEVRDDWRLYDPAALRRELEAAGFTVERVSHANALPALAATVRQRLRRGRSSGHEGGSDHHHESAEPGLGIPEGSGTGLRDRVSHAVLGLEARWLGRHGRVLRFGHSLVAVAQA